MNKEETGQKTKFAEHGPEPKFKEVMSQVAYSTFKQKWMHVFHFWNRFYFAIFMCVIQGVIFFCFLLFSPPLFVSISFSFLLLYIQKSRPVAFITIIIIAAYISQLSSSA
jgi:hypothetical protein